MKQLLPSCVPKRTSDSLWLSLSLFTQIAVETYDEKMSSFEGNWKFSRTVTRHTSHHHLALQFVNVLLKRSHTELHQQRSE